MFKDILLDLMNERNLNQRQLAQKANIPPTTISGWLNAGRLPDYNALIKLSKFFGVSGDFLLGLED
ncbi:MAG: helix-turn-helix transcriptional regulator [Clostridiales bacterium]|nr:helix-turn-helix transcriptional regulator [Clostridiales bacterium]